MKKFMKKNILISALILGAFITPSYSQDMSDHDADCAIWLCLPSGFPSGCGKPLSKFKDRIKHLRSPLPSWSSCAVSANNGQNSPQPYTIKFDNATYTNNGKGYTKKIGRSYSCPKNGLITTTKKRSTHFGYIIETWVNAVCTRTSEVSNTLNDYVWIQAESGVDLEYTKSDKFKPYLLSTKHVNSR